MTRRIRRRGCLAASAAVDASPHPPPWMPRRIRRRGCLARPASGGHRVDEGVDGLVEKGLLRGTTGGAAVDTLWMA